VIADWARSELGQAWIVHRLDRDTSGVLLLARSAEAHRRASLWFQKHEVRKTYEFLARGRLRAPMLRISAPIDGAASATQVESREELPGPCFLGRAVPLTGRRHQIRIHLSEQGNPLLGDPEYGGPTELGGTALGRVALHAARLELPSREVFTAPWPADFMGWVDTLRAASQGGADGRG
jgi:23S rRNA-/tRNA-specific pseudouridylate synthase